MLIVLLCFFLCPGRTDLLTTNYLGIHLGLHIAIWIFHDTDNTKCHVAGGPRCEQGYGFSSLTPLFSRQWDFPGRLPSGAKTAGKQCHETCASSTFSSSSRLLLFSPHVSFFLSLSPWLTELPSSKLAFCFSPSSGNMAHLTRTSPSVPAALVPIKTHPSPPQHPPGERISDMVGGQARAPTSSRSPLSCRGRGLCRTHLTDPKV